MSTGCGHAGVINWSRHAFDLGMGVPLFAVVGGFHLADAQPHIIEKAMHVLKELNVKAVLAGHCTGWRAKSEFHKQMTGCFAPCFVGSHFTL
jgi:7,8-dihydropterin-6-yl-methyl-4-(beta-D-ribofuranosyl)aminobenzene 5'-phosphate synthase